MAKRETEQVKGQYVAYKLHHNGESGFIYGVPDGKAATLIEAVQRRLAGDGLPTGITWQLVETDSIADALIACARIDRKELAQ